MASTVMRRTWDDHTDKVSRRSDRWASSDRGWFYIGERCFGHYLDYGPEHFRSGHQWCRGECECALSQPGSVHAVRFKREALPYGHSNPHSYESRYFPTVAAAKAWIEAYN